MSKPKRKNKPGQGRPAEGREALKLHVLPATAQRIRALKSDACNTLGKVLDHQFAK